jgi:hypothetical protein
MPTATPTFSPASNWNRLSNKCGTSTCSIANGGCTITLSDDFAMESYSGEIAFSGKAITIWGQGKVLDASGGGRFFIGEGAGSFLDLHDAVLQNGDQAKVDLSGWNASCDTVLSIFPDFSLQSPIPGGGHATFRVVLFMPMMSMWRSTTPYSSRIAPLQYM